MARLVEDSEDEFPDIAAIANRKPVSGNTASRPRRGKSVQTDETREEPSNATKRRDEIAKIRVEGSRITARRKDDEEVVRMRPKKRILNQTSENPLLRPLATSASSKEVSGVTKWVVKIEPRRQKLARKQVPDVDSDDVSRLGSGGQDAQETVESRKQESPSKKVVPKEKLKAPTRKVIDLESDSEEFEGASGLSDFIVDDGIILENESVIESPPRSPRSVRKLVQGRRRPAVLEDSESEDLELQMRKLNFEDDVFQNSGKRSRDLKNILDDYEEENLPPLTASKIPDDGFKMKPSKASKTTTKQDMLTSDLEDPFTLSYSPPERKPRKVSKEIRFATPPRSPEPQPRKLQSPKKQFPRIPSTPHRQSMDTFWQQDVVNDWNDEHSPQKILFPKPKPAEDISPQSSPKKSPTKQDRVAKEAKKAFSQSKHALAESFLAELDTTITNGEIARLSSYTGGVKIIWSKKLNTTAGRANWKRETIRSSTSAPTGTTTYRHHAAIELAEKVIDDENRLLNVIAHEFCHLANFMVSGVKTNPHGKEFKVWAAKCSRHFGDRGIEVTTKHSYEIDYKYVWSCTNERCGMLFKRHSKSVDPKRHQCGTCKSKLVQVKPVPRVDAAGGVKISEYQRFVKENMKRVKEENPGSPQKDIMGLVGKEFQMYKASKVGDGVNGVEKTGMEEVTARKEGSPDGDVGDVVRKLDFFDLRSH
ncbi:uncharacterized protein RSE6_14720 [Rhynchosporium secalis]|uniref:SprT-like domain-containing protein n=1 Tax=Rhynchosporium secalis TaxID=38038 RepID=A0A1E1MW25_RHYSE|nr:uncharacterized protein RSE6_14720 [Rhynchosporium secalis]